MIQDARLVPQRAPVAGVRPEPGAGVHHPRLQHPRRRHPRRASASGCPRASRRIKGRLGLTTVTRPADQAPPPASDRLLSVDDLSVEFLTEAGPATVVDHVSFGVDAGEVVALVGESGSGKTVSSLAVMRLVASPPGRITSGSVMFDGRDLLSLSFKELRELRGDQIAMAFQDPMTSLNPAFTIGTQLVDTIRLHRTMSKSAAARTRARAARARGHPRPRAAARRLPAPALGRHAPARVARARALVRAASCSSPTSPPPRSTSPSRRRSSTCCARCRRAPAWR